MRGFRRATRIRGNFVRWDCLRHYCLSISRTATCCSGVTGRNNVAEMLRSFFHSTRDVFISFDFACTFVWALGRFNLEIFPSNSSMSLFQSNCRLRSSWIFRELNLSSFQFQFERLNTVWNHCSSASIVSSISKHWNKIKSVAEYYFESNIIIGDKSLVSFDTVPNN